jgi:hypothetical protein
LKYFQFIIRLENPTRQEILHPVVPYKFFTCLHYIKGSSGQKRNNFTGDIFNSINWRNRHKKTAPAKEGDATRAVCKENSFKILIGNIYSQVNYYPKKFNAPMANRHDIAGRENNNTIVINAAYALLCVI